MHKVLGWIAISLLMIGAGVGAWLAGGALTARTFWMERVAAKQKTVEDSEKNLRIARQEFETARNDLHNERDLWGRDWDAPNSGPSPAGDGTVELGVGTNAGLGQGQPDVSKLPVVYVFGKNADGTTTYVGDLALIEVRQDTSGGKLTRNPYANEVANWPRGDYRVRESIPDSYRQTISGLRGLTSIALQAVSHEMENVKRQTENLANSQKALATRMAELNGNPDEPPEAGPDIQEGLVQRLRVEEAERNAQIKAVDALRRELSDQHLRLTKTLAANQDQLKSIEAGRTKPRAAVRVVAQP